ncbi:MAG: hypothetical protein JSS76_18890 [Bacteroidetes bacterium]|nr:hypothetical protein [Bacteroidota bacterium]
MKRTLVLLVASFYVCVSIAQNNAVKISWSEEYEIPKKHEDLGFFGNPLDGYVDISQQRGKDLTIQRFNADLKYTDQSEVSLSTLPKNYMIEKIMEMDQHYYVFYSTYDADVERLWSLEVDVKSGAVKGAPVKIAESKEKLAGQLVMTGFYQMQVAGKWNFIPSADGQKLLVYYRVKPKEKRDALNNDVIGFYVFDSKMRKLWNNDFTMPYTEEKMDNIDYQVDQSGNAYILGKVYEEGHSDSKNNQPNYHFELMTYGKGTKGTNFKMNFGEKYIVDAALIESTQGSIICSGYYSKSRSAINSDGVFFVSFDESTKTIKNIAKGFYEFPADVIKQFETTRVQRRVDKKEEKGDDNEVANLEFRNLVTQDDGSFTLFGEQYHTTSSTRYNNTTTTTYNRSASTGYTTMSSNTAQTGSVSTTRYYYDDIYVVRIGSDGELSWVKKIPKRQNDISQQTTGNANAASVRAHTAYLSFFLHTKGSSNYVFFVDNQKNFNLPADQQPAAYGAGARGELVCVKLDQDGTMSKSHVFDFKEENLRMLIGKFNSVTPDQIIGRAFVVKGAFQLRFTEGKALRIDVN